VSGHRESREEQLGRLIGLLEPVPRGWVRAACEVPLLTKTLDTIVARAEADQAFRQALVADFEAALEAVGYEPEPRLVAALRQRFEPAS
jgi:hypothetical protein